MCLATGSKILFCCFNRANGFTKRHCLPSLKGVIFPLIVSRIVPFDEAES